jgi:hypothetical protein
VPNIQASFGFAATMHRTAPFLADHSRSISFGVVTWSKVLAPC